MQDMRKKQPLLIDGLAVAAELRAAVAQGVAKLCAACGTVPGLAVVLVGEDPASAAYVRMKERDCAEAGIATFDHFLPAETTQEELLALIDRLNLEECVHGILVQLPLPAHLDESLIVGRIAPEKDVDGFTPVNVGRLLRGESGLRACTPAGVMRLLDHYGVELKGRHAVVVGRSTIVGKPMALMLLERHATVTICHSRTSDLPGLCRGADVLVAAVGRAGLIDASYVKPGAVVIDVGINRGEDGLVGDVDFDAVAPVAGAITPVPGGVGPMTRALLLENTLQSALDAVSRRQRVCAAQSRH